MLLLILESAMRTVCVGAGVWLALRLTGVHRPRFEMLVWTLVLIGGLTMPVLMHCAPVRIPSGLRFWPTDTREQTMRLSFQTVDNSIEMPSQLTGQIRAASPAAQPIDWWNAAAIGYATIALCLLLRTGLGLVLTQRVCATAKPLAALDPGFGRVRISPHLSVPMTFGRTIVLPTDSTDWSHETMSAVLAHELSHLDRGDFFILLLATVHRAVFWISPLAWWLPRRLARLAETISDEAGIQSLGDRPSYAAILLDVASKAHRTTFGVAMARHADVTQRMEHILSGTIIMEPKLNWRRKAIGAAIVLPITLFAAGAGAQSVTPNGPSASAPPPQSDNRQLDPTLKNHLDAFVGTFRYDPQVFPNQVVELTHTNGHFFAQMTGGSVTEVIVRDDGDFIYNHRHLAPRNATFVGDKVNALDIDWRGRTIRLERVDDGEAKRMNDLRAQRLAEQAAPKTVTTVEPQILENYVGYYKLFDDKVLTITREGSHLYDHATGENRVEVFPYADRSFFYTTSATQLTFEPDADGHINMAVRHYDGWVYHAPRITEAEAKKINDAYQDRLAAERKPHAVATIDPQQFDKYVGRYLLYPRVTVTTSRDGDKFYAQLTNQPKFQIYPENDTIFFYTVVAAQISFETDPSGKTTRLVLHQNGWDSPAERLD